MVALKELLFLSRWTSELTSSCFSLHPVSTILSQTRQQNKISQTSAETLYIYISPFPSATVAVVVASREGGRPHKCSTSAWEFPVVMSNTTQQEKGP